MLNADSLGGEVGKILSHNVFAYSLNNPINMADPTGNIAWWIIGAGVGAVAGAVIAGANTGWNWKYMLAGAAAGALVGAGLGYAAEAVYASIAAAGTTIPSALDQAQKRASQLKEGLSKTQISKLPRATSAAVDRTTGRVYYGNSGTISNNINKVLKARMPNPSLEKWQVANCAEFNAVNNALNSGSRINNLDVATVMVKSEQAFPMCRNCQVTIFGANVITK